MSASEYSEPVSNLITLGDVREQREWHDYAALGLTEAHIPDLIRLALDEELAQAEWPSDEVWARLHAWRALGQLRAVEAVEPLTTLFDALDEEMNDWITEDLPEALSLIGPKAIPVLRDFLGDPIHGQWSKIAAASGLVKIAEQYPEARADVIAILSAQLEHFMEQDRGFNASLASYLVYDLHAVESIPLIERVYAADKADLMVMGDWEDVQIKLGLLEERLTSQPDYFAKEMPELVESRDRMQATLNNIFPEAQPAQPPKQKPGRNDPCWCGSGKKYKHCHLREDRKMGRF